MIEIKKATFKDAERLTETQTRTFQDDNKLKPPGCNMGGPPGYDSVDWNAGWIEKTPYYKILFDDQIVGGIIVFELGKKRYELGRMWVDPDFQNRDIGQQAVRKMFEAFPEAKKWIIGTPSWAIRNQHFYEKMGFVKVRETKVDPDLGWSGIEYEKNCTSGVTLPNVTRELLVRRMKEEIQEIVDRETQAWDTQDVELLLSIFHPDMVWPWPPTNDDHDPMNWVMVLGKFDHQRWGQIYQQFFQEYKLVHNKRETKKIETSEEGDGAFAVVDIDTLWVDTRGRENHWLGRVCKVYAKVGREWKMTMHTGVLRY